jgi:hypothetical protein
MHVMFVLLTAPGILARGHLVRGPGGPAVAGLLLGQTWRMHADLSVRSG